ncbi:substrate-binding periplasmic protein [Hahella ganghwensis]|uniref:substrate-binding periplasmic protein n=1 Tax=Hahella ganghwensis TaxID=286420 RepID=UPI00035C8381|nr:ABC transporter substrate-binding protein [Hahella ganghwensis]
MKKVYLLAITLLLVSANLSAKEIQFFTHSLQNQTFIDKHGELRGKEHAGKRAFGVELIRAMMDLLEHPHAITEVPFKRGLYFAQQSPRSAFFNLSRTPERERTVKWVGPIQVEEDYFYEMKKAPTGVTTLEDAKNVAKICVLNGAVHHTILSNHYFTNIEVASSYVHCFKMLELGRVQLTPSASSSVLHKLKEAGIAPEKVQQTPVLLLQSGGYLVFSKDVDDAEIAQWQQALEQLKASGEYQRLYQRYFLP